MAVHPPQRHEDLRGLSLCAGVGGLDLGLHLAEPGYRAVGYVERNSFAAAVLVARMADASLAPAAVWDDLKSFDGCPWRGRVHIVTAGYPCQPFTLSGDRKGAADPRHLWPDVARVISEVRPIWAFFENVPGHLSLGFHDVVRDLQGLGYRVAACVVSAAEVGGSHIRERLFILAHADGQDERQSCFDPAGSEAVCDGGRSEPIWITGKPADGGSRVDDALGSTGNNGVASGSSGLFAPMPGDFVLWGKAFAEERAVSQPILHRLVDGVACGLDRSAAAGNGVVPLAAARAWAWLKRVHEGQYGLETKGSL